MLLESLMPQENPPGITPGDHNEQHPIIVDYRYLLAQGIFTNRVDAARKRAADFPAAIELSPGRIGWFWHEVAEWLASRPRRAPKTSGDKPDNP
jgi:hypothetical protein